MAQGNIFGMLSGKIGSVVVYERNGKQIVRSNPKQRDPKTPKQLAHRLKFSLVNKGLSPLNKVIKLGYRNSDKNYRKLVGEAYHNAIIGEYPNFALDYSKIKVAEGDLQLPSNVDIKTEADSNMITISWNTQIYDRTLPGRPDDQVNIVCLDSVDLNSTHWLNVAQRSDGKVTFKLPIGWECATSYFWIFLTSYDMQMNSYSLFVSF